MKIVYVAHPLAENLVENIIKIKAIMKDIWKTWNYQIYPIAPYLHTLEVLEVNDGEKSERDMGISANKHLFVRKAFDELWVCGAMSKGVCVEIEWASDYGIPVRFYDFDTVIKSNNFDISKGAENVWYNTRKC